MIRALEGHRLALDISYALLFTLAALPWADYSGTSDVLAILFFAAAMAVRRLSPTISLAAAWLGAIVQMAGHGYVMAGNIAILFVLYAVARYGSPRLRWIGLGSAGLGAIVATIYLVFVQPRFNPVVDSIPVMPTLFEVAFTLVGALAVLVLSWTVGLVARLRAQGKEVRMREAEERYRRERSEQTVIVEQERNQIARDMHDVVAHSLAVVIAQADGARYAVASNPDAATEALGTIAASARSALGEVRVLLTALRHREGEGPQPGLVDLEALFEQLRGAGLVVLVERTGAPIALGIGHEIAAYRIVQEALTNALRHGVAGQVVWVRLDWWDRGLAVTVDNAITPAVASAPASTSGHGLPGMRERAALVGGTFAAGTVDGARFRITAMIPAPPFPGGYT